MATDISKSGFAAISKEPPKGPLARKQLVRNADGTVTLRYVDNDTGLQLQSLDGYNLVEANNYMSLDDLNLNPLSEEKEQTVANEVKKPPIPDNQRVGGDSDSASQPMGNAGGFAGPTNNFGYMNKPGWAGLAGAIPGPIGFMGKAANVAINASNTSAMNKARDLMGLPKQSFAESFKSTIKDQHGQIGDVKLETPQGVAQYPVGFEAQDKFGRTNMTPQEAALRGRANQSPLSLATRTDVKSAVEDFKKENPEERQGLFSQFTSAASNFIDNLFGRDDTSRSGYGDSGSGGFSLPDHAPVPEARPSAHSMERERDFSGGGEYSSQAEAAMSKGGGLY